MDENQEKKAEKPKKEMTKRAARKIFKAACRIGRTDAGCHASDLIRVCRTLNKYLGHPEKKLGFFLRKRKK